MKAQESDYLLSAQDGLLFDPGLKGFTKRIIGDSKRHKTAIVDEIRAHELFTEYSIELKDLQRINDEWQGTSAERMGYLHHRTPHHQPSPGLRSESKRCRP